MFDLDIPNDLDMVAGKYVYKIYGSEDDTTTDTELLNLLEVGMASVKEEGGTNVFYEPTPLQGTAYGNS